MKIKKCSKCKAIKPVNAFNKYRRACDGLFPQCKDCTQKYNKNYYLKNKEKVKRSASKWKMNNPKRANELRKRERDNLKIELINAYGGKCTCCGESHTEFLTLEHKDGNGAEHKRILEAKNGSKPRCDMIWREVRREGFPPTYTILCMNCNFARGAFGYCPHEKYK